MVDLQIEVEAAHLAMRKAKDKLDDARDTRSRISSDLDACEDRLAAAGKSKHRIRMHEELCRDYDDCRVRVQRALDSHAELSCRYLHLLNQLTDAEDQRRSNKSRANREREESQRRAWTRARSHTSRRAYLYTTADGGNQSTSGSCFDSDSRHSHAHRSDRYREHDRARSRTRFDHEEHFMYTTEEHAPRSSYRQRSQSSESDRQDESEFVYMSGSDTDECPLRSSRFEPCRPGSQSSRGYSHYDTTEEHRPRTKGHHHRDDTRPSARPRYHFQSENPGRASTWRRQSPSESPRSHYTTEEREPRPRRQSSSRASPPSNRHSTREHESSHHFDGSTPRSQQRKTRSRSEDRPRNSAPPRHQPQAEQSTRLPSQQTVDHWMNYAHHCFQNYSAIDRFPIPPPLTCGNPDCEATSSQRPFLACEHTIRASFGIAGITNLKRERLRWHPDKFSACKSNLQESFKKMASEVFTACA